VDKETQKKIAGGVAIGLIMVMAWLGYEMFNWSINKVYVPEGQSLQLRYKGPIPFLQFWATNKEAQPGCFADEAADEAGVYAKLRGTGRHFYCPLWYERTIVDDIVIAPGQVGVVTCKLGDSLPEGEFLVDGDIGETKHKGILRKALGPGRYRINPYAYTVVVVASETSANGKKSGWVNIPTGYVGVVTNLAANPLMKQSSGIQNNVLPPGIYPINGREQQVDVIFVGYIETTLAVSTKVDENNQPIRDESGEPTVENGVNFPSSDGFSIHLDYTLIWGLTPEQAPHAIKTFGNIEQVMNKVITPQMESVCRNNGSEYSAVELLVGEKREIYQKDVLEGLHSALDDKELSVLYGLIRHIYIPQEVRKPIQSSFVADELALTRTQEQETTKNEALLKEAERKVELASATVEADTDRLAANITANGEKEAKTVAADTVKKIAAINRETAELDAQALTLKGEAESMGKQLVEEAKSNKFKLAVEAFGTPQAYNNWTFANGLPSDIELKMFYAGEGTLWTDLKTMNVVIDPSKKK